MRVYKSHCVSRGTLSIRGPLGVAVLPAWLYGFVKMGMHKLRGLLRIFSTLNFRWPG